MSTTEAKDCQGCDSVVTECKSDKKAAEKKVHKKDDDKERERLLNRTKELEEQLLELTLAAALKDINSASVKKVSQKSTNPLDSTEGFSKWICGSVLDGLEQYVNRNKTIPSKPMRFFLQANEELRFLELVSPFLENLPIPTNIMSTTDRARMLTVLQQIRQYKSEQRDYFMEQMSTSQN
jgi:hypothetical protein